MKIIDSHVHLNSERFDEDRDEVFKRIEENLDFVVNIGYDLESSEISVDYANKNITEITCHAKGAEYLLNEREVAIIDIGGQDTKIIVLEDGQVKDFIMNDKCSAGTGRFLEVMANAMG